MINTAFSKPNNHSLGNMSHHNHLAGKVVLLIGSDTATLATLIIQLAQKGADIALICRQISTETNNRFKERVESLGQRFFSIEKNKDHQLPNDVAQTIVTQLGHPDIYIDLSTTDTPPSQNKHHDNVNLLPSNWPLMQTFLNTA